MNWRPHIEANDAEPKQHPPNHQDSWTSCPEVAADSSSPVWLDQNNGRRGRPALARAALAIVGNLGRCTAVETFRDYKMQMRKPTEGIAGV